MASACDEQKEKVEASSDNAIDYGGTNLHQYVSKGELTFQNLRYIITVCVTPADALIVEAEQKSDGARWRASFSSRSKFHKFYTELSKQFAIVFFIRFCYISSSSFNSEKIQFDISTSFKHSWNPFDISHLTL